MIRNQLAYSSLPSFFNAMFDMYVSYMCVYGYVYEGIKTTMAKEKKKTLYFGQKMIEQPQHCNWLIS